MVANATEARQDVTGSGESIKQSQREREREKERVTAAVVHDYCASVAISKLQMKRLTFFVQRQTLQGCQAQPNR